MKKYVRFLGFMLTLSTMIVLNACSKDDDKGDNDNKGNNGNTEVTANMTGKINGEPFSWEGKAEILGDVISLSACAKTFTPRINLLIPLDVIAGQSYPITLYGDCNALFVDSEGYQIKVDEDDDRGMITITEYDKAKKTIKGTFSFSTPRTLYTPAYSITEGSFNYVYEILF